MAGHFDLNQVAIAGASRSATSAPLDASKVWRAAQHLTRPRLDALAARIEPALSWDDLVLPAEQLTMLTHLVDQVRGRATVMGDWGFGQRGARGTGSTALFAGPSGTGKTLAAEVIAGELDLCLYRIDLSGIVSKYIGDTERNLRRVFDAAEEGGALLFFDEADALFGKRSEVRDSHDRYANIEVNYLLQRMEDYRGIAILATNQRSALDQAFLRRLRVVVTFPHPTRDDRAALWRRAFPPRTPTVGIDVERLAQLSATGGMIRNIALNAATCAAGRRSAVTMDMVLAMARMEFVKLELPVNEQDFADVGVGAR
jgi:SpoVK/Ycf46/Vps4 family AAA+-type ATPase